MKSITTLFLGLMLFNINLSAEEADPNLFDFKKNGHHLIFTCKQETCSYDDKHSGEKGIPLLKNWAITKPFYYETAAGIRANAPSIEYVDTKSGLWIRQNPRQIMEHPDFVKCEGFSDYMICLSQAKVNQKSRKQGEKLMQLLRQWRSHSYQLLKQKAKAEAQTLTKQGLKKYTGAYFGVIYPANFIAKPPQKSLTDEASFSSPDGHVEFFVYSPLWSGKPERYLKKRKNEKLVAENSKKTFKKKAYRNYIVTQWKTFKDKKSSYIRSYVAQRACHDDGKSSFNDCTNKVFGIKYKDKKTYAQYKSAYLKFKKSLEQYAD